MLERRSIVLLTVIIVATALLVVGCVATANTVITIDFNRLIDDAEKYNGKTVSVEGYYFSGFEITALSGNLQASSFREGNVMPVTPMIWLTGTFPENFKDGLNEQSVTPSGYPEYYGKVRITGTFQCGSEYGHMNAYDYKITVTDFKVLSEVIKGSLEVLITDTEGNPLWGAKVVSEMQPAGQLKVTGITGEDGKVSFSEIKTGAYRFYVSRFDYLNVEFTADVTSLSDEPVTVILEQEQVVPTT